MTPVVGTGSGKLNRVGRAGPQLLGWDVRPALTRLACGPGVII